MGFGILFMAVVPHDLVHLQIISHDRVYASLSTYYVTEVQRGGPAGPGDGSGGARHEEGRVRRAPPLGGQRRIYIGDASEQ